jgi:hypothetical protein
VGLVIAAAIVAAACGSSGGAAQPSVDQATALATEYAPTTAPNGTTAPAKSTARPKATTKPKPTTNPSYYTPPGWDGVSDVNCSDFKTHAQAQSFFKGTGGSHSNDPYGLDRDHDGIACETLP